MNQPTTTPPNAARDITDDFEPTPNETAGRPPVRPALSGGAIAAVIALGVVLVGIIAVAFRGSWTAHRDAALAAHFDQTGADLYPFAPDGLIVIALIAAMVLRHDKWTRIYALGVVGLFTFTSFVVNHLHGLGTFALDQASGELPPLPWPVVALIAGQLIGAIGLGSHLIVCALRYLFPGTHDYQGEHLPGTTTGPVTLEPAVRVMETVLDPDPEDVARKVYGIMLDLHQPIGRDKLAKACGIQPRAAVRVRKAVEQEREEADLQREEEARQAAERDAREEEAAATSRPGPTAEGGAGRDSRTVLVADVVEQSANGKADG